MSDPTLHRADRDRCRHGLGLVDASVVAIGERLGLTTVATLNERDFRVVRPAHTEAFQLVP